MALPTNQLTSVDKELLSAAKSQSSLLNRQSSVLKGLTDSITKQRKELEELRRASTNQKQFLGGNGGMSSLAKMFGAKGAATGLKGSPLGPKDETNTGFFKKIVTQITGPSRYQQQLINEIIILKEVTQRQAQDIAFIKSQSEPGAKSRERSLLASAIAKAMEETERPSNSSEGSGGILSTAAKGIGGVLKSLVVGFGAALTGAAMLIGKFGKSLPGLFVGALRLALTPAGIAAIIAALIGVKAYKELQGKTEGAGVDADGEPIATPEKGGESFFNKLKRFFSGENASDVWDKKDKDGNSLKALRMQQQNPRIRQGSARIPRPADPVKAAEWDKKFGGKYDPITGNPLPKFEEDIVGRTRGATTTQNGLRVGGAKDGPDPKDRDVVDMLGDTLDDTTDYFKDFNETMKKALEGLETIGENIVDIAKDTLDPTKIEDMLNNLLTINFGTPTTDTINLAPYLGTAIVQTLKDITDEGVKITDYMVDKASAATNNIVTNNTVVGGGKDQGSTSTVIPGSAKRSKRDSWDVWTEGLGKR